MPEGAPLLRDLVEDEGPLVLARLGEESVGAGSQLLAPDLDVGAEGDGGRFVGARPPDLAIGNKAAPDRPAFTLGRPYSTVMETPSIFPFTIPFLLARSASSARCAMAGSAVNRKAARASGIIARYLCMSSSRKECRLGLRP